MQAKLSDAAPGGERLDATAAETLPATQLRLSRVTCVTESLVAVSSPSARPAAEGAQTDAIGYLVVRERRTIRSVARSGDGRPSAGASGDDNLGAVRRASATAPTAAAPAIDSGPSGLVVSALPEMLPHHPDDVVTAELPAPGEFDFVATPRDVSFTAAPGAESRFDPEKRNGDLRKGIRWLTRLITGEEQ